jgi:peptide deformylase
MATKNDIITLPHASLRSRSKKVGFISDEVRSLIEDMKSATLDWEASRKHEVGVALAAVQINRLSRVVIIRNNFDNPKDKTFTVLINPEVTKAEGDITYDYEGCLSIKNLYGFVPRYSKVKVKAIDEEGHEFRMTAEGFMARILQHEIDHTNGIVYIDHIKDDKEAFFQLDEEGHLNPINHDTVIKDSLLWQ